MLRGTTQVNFSYEISLISVSLYGDFMISTVISHAAYEISVCQTPRVVHNCVCVCVCVCVSVCVCVCD